MKELILLAVIFFVIAGYIIIKDRRHKRKVLDGYFNRRGIK